MEKCVGERPSIHRFSAQLPKLAYEPMDGDDGRSLDGPALYAEFPRVLAMVLAMVCGDCMLARFSVLERNAASTYVDGS